MPRRQRSTKETTPVEKLLENENFLERVGKQTADDAARENLAFWSQLWGVQIVDGWNLLQFRSDDLERDVLEVDERKTNDDISRMRPRLKFGSRSMTVQYLVVTAPEEPSGRAASIRLRPVRASSIRAHGLKSHMASHSTDTPFECGGCGKRFKNEIMLLN